jgi:hypothetical protein
MTDDVRGEPVQEGALEATDDERIAGIVEQVRGDITRGTEGDPVRLLRQRLDDAGVAVSDEQFEELVAEVLER